MERILNEKEQSLKKKIFSLAKMEALVFSDPKLTAVYDQMAENGEERYGYHYNETIMNIIFNDYILNSSKYLQKYKAAIPKKKKRRDKSGINSLKQQLDKSPKPQKKSEKNETTSAGSAGGSAGYVGYETPHAFAKNKQPMRKPLYHGGVVVGEEKTNEGGDWLKGEKAKPIKSMKGSKIIDETKNYLMNSETFELLFEAINSINVVENEDNLEQVKAEAQRISREEGVVQHVNRVNNNRYKVDDWYDDENTVVSYENGRELSENINEHHLNSVEDKKKYILSYYNSLDGSNSFDLSYFDGKSDEEIDYEYKNVEKNLRYQDFDPEELEFDDEITEMYGDLPNNYNKEELTEKAVSKSQQKFMGMVRAVQKGELKPSEVGKSVAKAAKNMKPDDVVDFAATKHKKLPEKIKEESMIDNNETSMKVNKEPINTNSSEVEMGTQASGGISEDFDYNTELEKFQKINESLKKLLEDKKTSSMINKERIGGENAKNFNSDMKKSGTMKVVNDMNKIDKENEKKSQTNDLISLDDIEKKSEKEAFKNVGDSANLKGDEIPKRNHTDDEKDDVDNMRYGMEDWVYDNKVGERFEERMKDDMGEDMYEKRQEKLKVRANMPMYNKDKQPVEDFDDKPEDRIIQNVNENLIGKYYNEYNKVNYVNFDLNNAKAVDKIEESYVKLDLSGLGNKYIAKIQRNGVLNENSETVSLIDDFEFYLCENDIYYVKKKEALNESAEKNTVNRKDETFEKFKHLAGYDPRVFNNQKR